MVPNDIWAHLSPTGDEGSILCIQCMAVRCIELELDNVPLKITSGPFALQDVQAQLSTARREVRRATVEELARIICTACSYRHKVQRHEYFFRHDHNHPCSADQLWRYLAAQEAAEEGSK